MRAILSVTLPWPDARLSPNSRVHWAQKAEAAKNQREHAYWLAFNERKVFNGGEMEMVKVFSPPDKRRRDLDNLGAMCKSYQDGIFDNLGVDDSVIVRTVNEWGEVGKGEVVMTLYEVEE